MPTIPGYGRGPLHLLGIVLCYALVAYAGARLLDLRPGLIFLAFLAGIILHDFVFFPLYLLADGWLRALRDPEKRKDPAHVPWINHVRAPVIVSAMLLMFYFPIILRLADERPEFTGLSQDPFLYRWLAVTAVLFVGSGLIYALRVWRARRAVHAASS